METKIKSRLGGGKEVNIMQAIIITDGTVEEIAALILAVQEQHGEIDVQDIARQFQEGLEEAISKNSGEQKTLSSFVNLAQETENLGLEDEEFGMPAQWTGEIVGQMHTHGITAQMLSNHLGYRPEYVSAILNGKREPKGAEQKFRQALKELTDKEA